MKGKEISKKMVLDHYLICKSFETSVIGLIFTLILFFFTLSGISHHKLGLMPTDQKSNIVMVDTEARLT